MRAWRRSWSEAVAVGLASGPDLSEEEVFDRLEAKYLAMAGKQV